MGEVELKKGIKNALTILEAELRLFDAESDFDKGVVSGLEHAIMVIKANVEQDEETINQTSRYATFNLCGFFDSGVTDLHSNIAYFIGIRCAE